MIQLGGKHATSAALLYLARSCCRSPFYTQTTTTTTTRTTTTTAMATFATSDTAASAKVTLSAAPIAKLFINNNWIDNSSNNKKIDIYNPATGDIIYSCPEATASDVESAVTAASQCFYGAGWGLKSSGTYRADYLEAFATALEDNADVLAAVESTDMGKPLAEALEDCKASAEMCRMYAEMAKVLDSEREEQLTIADKAFNTVVIKEPLGIIAAITPWNFPILMAVQKVSAALAAGCTVVLKPSELSPGTALKLAEIALAIGLPAGALNVVTGAGVTGAALSSCAGVDKISFTGSVNTGKVVMGAAASTGPRAVSLELGGKSSFIVFDDADVDATVDWAMLGIFFNAGQVCSATSRLLMHEKIAPAILSKMLEKIQGLKLIDPKTPAETASGPLMGPIVSAQQKERVLGFIDRAIADPTVKVLCGGGSNESSTQGKKGYWVAPTVLLDVPEGSEAWEEEIFGPVLCVRTFKTEEEAVTAANNTKYGLAAAVSSQDQERCARVARHLRAGIVWSNCNQPAFVQAPWGGFKQSGFGRELGKWGLEEFMSVKQVTSTKPNHCWKWYC